jgi:EAL domain-containing protein (putative c-di-GMP-specific phosphodiesterase class I)
MLISAPTNDVITNSSQLASRPYQVRKYPEVAYKRWGDGLFGDSITWQQEYSANLMSLEFGRGSTASTGVQANTFNLNGQAFAPGKTFDGSTTLTDLYGSEGYNQDTLSRIFTRQELSSTFGESGWKVTPFTSANVYGYVGGDQESYSQNADAFRAIVATGVTDRFDAPPGDHVRLVDMPLSGWTLARHALELLGAGSHGPKPGSGAARMAEPGRASEAAAAAALALPGESRAGVPSEALAVATAEIEAVGRAFEESLACLHVLFQPIVHANDGSPYGHEALMRSLGPFKRPSELLAASERLDRVEDLGRTVRRCIAEAISNDPGLNHWIFVNLHPKEFRSGLLTGLDEPLLPFASRIVWEVTERDQLSYSNDIANTQQALKAAGYRVAIDDLGEGYASLSWLVRFVPDIAKLDLSLVRGIDQSQIKRDLVRAIVDACHKGGTLVVAEGVETLEEAAVLRDLNCDLLQGHLFARPAPPFADFG